LFLFVFIIASILFEEIITMTKQRIVAVTACPTGIAHTFMAANKITAWAKEKGIDVKVETQGATVLRTNCRPTISPAQVPLFSPPTFPFRTPSVSTMCRT
jgi:cellobiose-specific phosphotransferase system component IIB